MFRNNFVVVCCVLTISTSQLSAAEDFSGKQSQWKGFTRYDFPCDGRDAYVVVPKVAADGRPWVWRARFPNFHAEADQLLLERGFHVAYIKTDGMLGSPVAMNHWDAFYKMMTATGLSKKPALEGVSRGGLFVYGFAKRWPERVACIYADTPVCDFKSWPLGRGSGIGHQPTWQGLLKHYKFTEAQALSYTGNPVDDLQVIAAAKIPLLHIVSLNDKVVPPSENTFVLAKRYRKLGGQIEVIEVSAGTAKSNGHHFTHPNPKRAADFIQKHATPAKTTSNPNH